MSDYNSLTGAIHDNPFAQKIATEEAVAEHMSRMSQQDQEEMILGMKMRMAQ